ncbi:MAG: GNAT family protein [Candidatus Dormiibacterota bacterium]
MDLTGRLVRLRGLREADEPALVGILAEPAVTERLPLWALRPIGAQDVRRLIRDTDATTVRWGVEDRRDGALIGVTSVLRIELRDRNADWEIVLGGPDRWGAGLGTEACRLATGFALAHLAVTKVSTMVPVTNPSARHSAERAGYVLEGTQRRHVFRDGRLVDVDVLAAFADDPKWIEASAWI